MDLGRKRFGLFNRDPEIKRTMKRDEILLICGKKYMEMTKALCRTAGLSSLILEECGNRAALIALKPNLLGPIPASEGATTHPEVIEGVISYLREEGFENLVVMESSWVGDRTADSLLVTGVGELCERLGVPFWDLQEDKGVPADGAGMELKLCARVKTVDFLINLPVLKGHCQTRMTCALKNMKGCIPNAEKRRFHRMGLHDPIGHLSCAVRQGFILADMICPDLTFEDGGNPIPLDRLACALDPVLFDAWGARMIGLEADAVRYILIAQELGAGCADPDRAKVRAVYEKRQGGETFYERGLPPAGPLFAGDVGAALRLRAKVEEVDSCSACYGTLLPVLQRLEKEGKLDKIKDRICIGQGWKKKRGKLGIGNCTALFDRTLPGCPPSAEEIYRYLTNETGMI